MSSSSCRRRQGLKAPLARLRCKSRDSNTPALERKNPRRGPRPPHGKRPRTNKKSHCTESSDRFTYREKRGGEKGKLAFDLFMAASKFQEIQLSHHFPAIARDFYWSTLPHEGGLVAAAGIQFRQRPTRYRCSDLRMLPSKSYLHLIQFSR